MRALLWMIAPVVASCAWVSPRPTISTRLIHAHGEVNYCYVHQHAEAERTSDLVVHFAIAADGHVDGATVVAPQADRAELEKCVVELARQWTLPPSDHQAVQLDYTFHPAAGRAVMDAIQATIRSHTDEVKWCYQRRLNTQVVEGRVVLRLYILADGHMEHVRIALSEVKDEGLERCIADHALTWKFPPPIDGPIDVDYPFLLKTSPPETPN